MATRDRQMHQPRRKKPSFSSSLLDSIYQSIDESKGAKEHQKIEDFDLHRKNNATQAENEIESFRRAIMIEKWMENYSSSSSTPTSRHLTSNSGSSTDSSVFSSSSKSTPKSSVVSIDQKQRQKQDQVLVKEKTGKILQSENTTNRQDRFTKTKLRALKIYGDLKKVKEPISPGRKITNFLNSIFSPRKLKKNQVMEEWSSVRKTRPMKDTTTCSLASRSCLRQTPSSSRGNKSKMSVRFGPVSEVVDEDSAHVSYQHTNNYLSSTGLSSTRARGRKSIYDYDCSSAAPMPNVGSQFIKKNIESLRLQEVKNLSKHGFREQFYENESDLDNKSCTSSDLFELDHTVRVGIGAYEEELPVYGTTSLKAIASGFVK
ncbi:protein BIG GRAIN 1-like B [Olea europaea var. sylvestris]|uniref:Protein BIG GRAIN 1-like B n=1 Tax=Olea europaea subsp. europaea TaxID=158383 RepID=A0A8S0Q893_OLEEU|nr:protein BIG GRAIN 1-like B [Olea europaea var. sylvestris]CAA2963468.1 Hypothetical predicted protein [Olea europaea subsp. europaea]